MDPLVWSQVMQLATLVMGAVTSVLVVWLQLRNSAKIDATRAAVNGIAGSAIAAKAVAIRALAQSDPTPAALAAAAAAEEESRRHDAAAAAAAPPPPAAAPPADGPHPT